MTDPMELGRAESTDDGYLYEYPWRDPWVGLFSEEEPRSRRVLRDVSFRTPTVKYGWESHLDLSLADGASADLPSFELMNLLGLSIHKDDPSRFVDKSREDIFRCFRLKERGRTISAVRKKTFMEALKKADLSCLWVVAGEKMLFTHKGALDQHAQRSYTSTAHYKGNQLIADGPWFEDTHSGIAHIDPSRADKYRNG